MTRVDASPHAAGDRLPRARESDPRAPRTATVVLAGLVALAVAMGIGRFAFTPLLPMMLHDGAIDLASASWLASANYLGYLVGALLCTVQPWLWRRLAWAPVSARRWIRGGLAATVLLTLGMALPLPASWAALRFGAGVASAFVFVFTSGWCLAQLAARQAASLGATIYCGPGAGILVSGLLASVLVAWEWRAAAGWLLFGVVAAVLAATVWRVAGADGSPSPGQAARAEPGRGEAGATASPSRHRSTGATPDATCVDHPGGDGAATPAAVASASAAGSPPPAPASRAKRDGTEMTLLAVAYGIAGFGYIITATFLPVIARAAMPGSRWLDLFWPMFGAGVIVGPLLSTRLRGPGHLRLRLAACYVIQAAAVGFTVWWPTPLGFAAGSVLLGVPFTAISFFAMQEARRLEPVDASAAMGLLTALYGVGQILGPPLAAWLVRHSASADQGFARALAAAMAALVVGAALYLASARWFPQAQVEAGTSRRGTA
ncbi:YbfB/YjiJ family MFS transporter [Piscinibacter koreensis]|uniref:YbfB/YjiJ family MFS transporter n=1 Tax=Piscinibacter koreensis TaxID=2742824 RepID=A0A7Y6TUR7_9BURK|nr:YbfB/YjiJ family MFS transporter [Schlegelella koreensis]NUZ04263.1 YbfB/YjiJ family MFS transporter [Schlegelella koreensis]